MNEQKSFFILQNDKSILIAAVLFVVVFTTGCGLFGSPEISVEDAAFIPSSMFVGSASAFLTIKNTGDGSDTLIGCAIKEYPSSVGKIHDVVEKRMVTLEKAVIPAGETFHLKPGAVHLMFFKIPKESWKNLKELTLILKFKKSGNREIHAKRMQRKAVKPANPANPASNRTLVVSPIEWTASRSPHSAGPSCLGPLISNG